MKGTEGPRLPNNISNTQYHDFVWQRDEGPPKVARNNNGCLNNGLSYIMTGSGQSNLSYIRMLAE